MVFIYNYKKRKRKRFINFFPIIIVLLTIVIISLYIIDAYITPIILAEGDIIMRAKATEIINKIALDEFAKKFSYDDIIKVVKDKDGNIVMLQADTIKMNKIAADVTLKSQSELKKQSKVYIKVPLSYLLHNNLLGRLGPDVKIRIEPIGYIETKYASTIESAGINQVRHKIYVNMKTQVRVVLPMESNDVDINTEIPIAETVIVGKVPNNAWGLDIGNDKVKIKN